MEIEFGGSLPLMCMPAWTLFSVAIKVVGEDGGTVVHTHQKCKIPNR